MITTQANQKKNPPFLHSHTIKIDQTNNRRFINAHDKNHTRAPARIHIRAGARNFDKVPLAVIKNHHAATRVIQPPSNLSRMHIYAAHFTRASHGPIKTFPPLCIRYIRDVALSTPRRSRHITAIFCTRRVPQA